MKTRKGVRSMEYGVWGMSSIFILFAFFLTAYFLLPTPTHAQSLTEYTLLEPIPLDGTGVPSTTTNASKFLPGIFQLTLAIAGVLAVVRLMYAGIIYMSTDAYGSKSEAKGIIQDALWGLALTLFAWIIVATLIGSKDGSLEFNINLPTQRLPENTNPPGGQGGGQPLCQGDCPYTYTRNSTTIKYKDCSGCVEIRSLGLIAKTWTVDRKNVQINSGLGGLLKGMKEMGSPAFRITEAWPPTFNHVSQGHYDGTSADVSLSDNSPNSIKRFIDNAATLGLRVVYETESHDLRSRLAELGVPSCSGSGGSGCVLRLPSCSSGQRPCITGSHFSVYKE